MFLIQPPQNPSTNPEIKIPNHSNIKTQVLQAINQQNAKLLYRNRIIEKKTIVPRAVAMVRSAS